MRIFWFRSATSLHDLPKKSFVFLSAPLSNSAATMRSCPSLHAMNSGDSFSYPMILLLNSLTENL